VADAGLRFAAAWLPFELSGDENQVRNGLDRLPEWSETLRNIGAPGFSVGIGPCHDELNYLENLKRWQERLHRCAAILGEYDLRLALEYIGPRTSWSSGRYPFVHSLREAQSLIRDLPSELGLHLDSWHWHTAHDSARDLAALDGSTVLGVDLNDAPAGIETDDLYDMRRELPVTTGVIPIGEFVTALASTGFRGPIQVEPFNATLSSLAVEAAVTATAQSLRRAEEAAATINAVNA
jgi:sugar phosphate isomerase/epimerase